LHLVRQTVADRCFDIVVVGGANTDYTIRGSALPTPKEPVSDGQFIRACGGKGLNQAVAASRLGASVALVAAVGEDERGREIIDCLAREQVAAPFVVRRPAVPTGASVIHVDADGGKQTAAALGTNLFLSGADIDAAVHAIAAARVLVVQLEIPLVAVERAVEIAASHRVPVVLDPAPAQPLPDSLIRGTHIIKPNAAEARVLTGIDVRNRESATAAARALQRRGATHVVVSVDAGTMLLSGARERWYANRRVKTVDTTGAGDAFAGGVAVALVEQRSIEDAVDLGHAAAALATTKPGALSSLPTRRELDEFLRTTYA
jgi:ribokinase